ncbi:MAG: prepilin-type N-terminal cleavage/methylation domain-containing protein [Candidatus Paceibacterota bacterium]
MKKRNKAFTLIELLVVILIITVLSAMVINSIASSRKKSNDAKRVSDISRIQVALVQYYAKCGQYPHTLDIAANNGCPSGSGTKLGSFISAIPRDPVSGGYWYFVRSDSGNENLDFVLRTVLSMSGNKVMTGSLGANLPTGTFHTYSGVTYDASGNYTTGTPTALTAVWCNTTIYYCVGSK